MNKIPFIVFGFAFLLLCLNSSAQSDSAWVSVTPDENYFTFKVPDTPTAYDTLNMYFCTFSVDSEIIMQVYYYRADTSFGDNTSDSIDNPLLFFAAELIYSTNGTLTSIDDINITSTIRGKEIGITYPVLDTSSNNDTSQVYIFTRVYHNGSSMLAFYISSPESRINELIAYRNLFFEDIYIVVPN